MTPPTNHEREKARRLVDEWWPTVENGCDIRTGGLIDLIAQALASNSRPPKDHIRLEDGADYKIRTMARTSVNGYLMITTEAYSVEENTLSAHQSHTEKKPLAE